MRGACHCGRSGWRLDTPFDRVTSCNCTLCRRYGALWAYGYEGADAGIFGETKSYTRADRPDPTLEIHFCAECGGVVGYRALQLDVSSRRKIAVNIRLASPDAVGAMRLERFDGLNTFEDLPDDGRRVRDIWF